MADVTPIPWQRPEHQRHSNLGMLHKFAEIQQEGFTLKITMREDIDHDWGDGRGTFTDTWQEGVIENPAGVNDRRYMRYFLPEEGEEAVTKSIIGTGETPEKAREMAKAQIQEDLRIAADPSSEGYSAIWVNVDVVFRGVVIASWNLGGTEVAKLDDPYLDEVTWECIQEALIQARKKKAELQQP